MKKALLLISILAIIMLLGSIVLGSGCSGESCNVGNEEISDGTSTLVCGDSGHAVEVSCDDGVTSDGDAYNCPQGCFPQSGDDDCRGKTPVS